MSAFLQQDNATDISLNSRLSSTVLLLTFLQVQVLHLTFFFFNENFTFLISEHTQIYPTRISGLPFHVLTICNYSDVLQMCSLVHHPHC